MGFSHVLGGTDKRISKERGLLMVWRLLVGYGEGVYQKEVPQD